MGSEEGIPPIPKRRLKLRIPPEIKREHIIQAIEELKKIGWPPRNNSTTYDLFYEGERYPPKIVVMYANKYANGELFDVSKFSGGEDTTNKFFRARDFTIKPKIKQAPKFRYIDPELSYDQYPVKENNKISLERENRIQIWKELQSLDNARNISPALLRDKYRIYRGAAGIWCDKERTSLISEDEYGITVSVLHTGKSYPDGLSEESIRYHYPKTDRPATFDRNEIEATKNAKRFQIPIFIITHSKNNNKLRDVHLGYVTNWNDDGEEKTFFIVFSDEGETLDTPPQIAENQPLDLHPPERNQSTRNAIQRNNDFRYRVEKRYDLKCAVCSITHNSLLHAAHIIPKDAKYTSDNERNGLILCQNHHAAFDAYLFGIHPKTLQILYPPNGPTKSALKIETDLLAPKRNLPDIVTLHWRFKEFQRRISDFSGASPRGKGRSPDERQTSLINHP